MAQSWLLSGGSDEEKQKQTEKVWKKSFPGSVFPKIDCWAVGGEVIKINQIREAGKWLSRKPVETAAKVLIVKQAEKMTASAANAFLKTLEEPPGESLIFLWTNLPYALPGTILSRCQRVQIRGKGEIFDKTEAEKWARKLVDGGWGERWKWLLETKNTREEWAGVLEGQKLVWREWLKASLSNEKQLKQTRQGLEAIIKAEKLLAANVNLKLVIGWLVLTLPKLRSSKGLKGREI